MSIAAAVEAALAPEFKPCKFARVLADLPGPDQRAIRDGLAGALGPNAASRILTANGFPVSEKAIRGHLAEDCCCYRAIQ